MEKYSQEEALAEAQVIKEMIDNGEAGSYAEAEEIIDTNRYQEKIWQLPTDEEVIGLAKTVDVNVTANTPIMSKMWMDKKEFKKLVEGSGTIRLLDLGSSIHTFESGSEQKDLIDLGIEEYVGVDLGITNSELQTSRSNPELKLKSIHAEILTAVHSFPNDYGNVWMTGIENGNVVNYSDDWGFALFAELKRVVPINGFVITDGGFADQVLEKISPEFKSVRKALQNLYYLSIWRKNGVITEDEAEKIKRESEEEVEKHRNKEGDPFFLNTSRGYEIGYLVVDVPETGWRIYFGFPESEGWYAPIVLINTRKTKGITPTEE